MTANADIVHGDGERRHLPECPQFCPYPDLTYCAPGASLPKCRGGDCTRCDEFDCICDALRSCEQRVRAEYDEYKAMLGGIEYGAERSWDYALDAAREAVKAGCGWRPAGRCSECTHATAAIEALSDTMRPDAATQ